MSSSSSFKVIGYAVIIFLLGGVCGAMLGPKFLPTHQTLKLGREQEMAAMIRNRLKTKLNLTSDQEQKIEPMIKQVSSSLETSHRDCLKKILEALNNMHAGLAPLLTPEQTAQLKELEAERNKSWLDKYNYSPETAAGH